MAKMKTLEAIKAKFMAEVKEFLEGKGEEVLLVKSGTFSIPWALDDEEGYLNVTFSMPKGSRDGDGYDGHEEAKNYELEQAVKKEERAKKEEAKQKKIARDSAARAKAKEKKEGKKVVEEEE